MNEWMRVFEYGSSDCMHVHVPEGHGTINMHFIKKKEKFTFKKDN